MKNILIIKFGGLGDFILSLHAMNLIKKFHLGDNLFLLTEKPYNEISSKSNWFKEIFTIKRSYFYFFDKKQIKNNLRNIDFTIIYDLQTSKRSSSYFEIFDNSFVSWSGLVKDNLFFHSNDKRNLMHTIERQRDQLAHAGIKKIVPLKTDWLFGRKFTGKQIRGKFAILAPGGSAKRKYKRIPTEVFINLSKLFIKNNITPVLIGTKSESLLCKKIESQCNGIINLCEKLELIELASFSRRASIAIGNDTGPMHMFALCGLKTIVFFTKYSNPDLCAPKGKDVKVLVYNGDKINFLKLIEKVMDLKNINNLKY